FAGHLNNTVKYVASRTLSTVDWQNAKLLHGDVVKAVGELKEQPGGSITVLGSGDLVQTLVGNDLVDEFSLIVSPIVLGSGKRLFRDATEPRRLRLVDSKTSSSGALILSYQPE